MWVPTGCIPHSSPWALRNACNHHQAIGAAFRVTHCSIPKAQLDNSLRQSLPPASSRSRRTGLAIESSTPRAHRATHAVESNPSQATAPFLCSSIASASQATALSPCSRTASASVSSMGASSDSAWPAALPRGLRATAAAARPAAAIAKATSAAAAIDAWGSD